MKKIVFAIVLVLLAIGTWVWDQNNQQPLQTNQTQQQTVPRQDQAVRGADDMRNLKIP